MKRISDDPVCFVVSLRDGLNERKDKKERKMKSKSEWKEMEN